MGVCDEVKREKEKEFKAKERIWIKQGRRIP
jgi:hypothetical protein